MQLRKLGTALLATFIIAPNYSAAQEMTAVEILALLQAQRDLLEAPDSGLGDSRALAFVVNSTPETEGDGVDVATEVAGEALLANTEGAAVPQDLVIDLTIFFEYDSALLKAESRSQVDALCSAIQISEEVAEDAAAAADLLALVTGETMNDAADTDSTENAEALDMIAQSTSGTYQIIGHTDASGSAAYNLTLSQARADEVVRYMVGECGIDASLLEAVGMGEARLKDTENPRAEINRRVEIQVTL